MLVLIRIVDNLFKVKSVYLVLFVTKYTASTILLIRNISAMLYLLSFSEGILISQIAHTPNTFDNYVVNAVAHDFIKFLYPELVYKSNGVCIATSKNIMKLIFTYFNQYTYLSYIILVNTK